MTGDRAAFAMLAAFVGSLLAVTVGAPTPLALAGFVVTILLGLYEVRLALSARRAETRDREPGRQ